MLKYATKSDSKNATAVDVSNCAKKLDLTNFEVYELNIDRLEIVPTVLNCLESKLDKLYVDKLVPVPRDLSKLSDVVKNDAVIKAEYDQLVKKVNAIQSTDTSNLVIKTEYPTKISEIKKNK